MDKSQTAKERNRHAADDWRTETTLVTPKSQLEAKPRVSFVPQAKSISGLERGISQVVVKTDPPEARRGDFERHAAFRRGGAAMTEAAKDDAESKQPSFRLRPMQDLSNRFEAPHVYRRLHMLVELWS